MLKKKKEREAFKFQYWRKQQFLEKELGTNRDHRRVWRSCNRRGERRLHRTWPCRKRCRLGWLGVERRRSL